ncbi:alpha-amylase [Geotalea uraniireducens]|uniref:Maltokinase n=1 Tax=Geotalea uraniireducens TaxID=351604 RepID=A0ABM8EMH5_9BACT|nr:maltose alpha-D-glucosyltransferase [Geotalea uraniireducens]BDV43787.1 alpha-amylase [Geotalea uraniireducens]
MAPKEQFLDDNPLWYRDAVIYQLHIKAFADSDGDGIGDFHGLMGKLDYLQSLGITAIWLLPFYPSPLRDDGYDIADYFNVNPSYNTLREFREFLRAAHRRGIRVITELVLNHTSDQHPWFQRARRARPGSAHRDFYVWSDTPEKYREARIIFQDFEASNWTWDPVAKSYYWHRFYSHQPDLNYDNPRVRAEMFRVVDFWLRLGVDGVRLDAVPYLYEREGTNCENLNETHAYLKELRAHIDATFSNRMLLGEANQWPEDAVAYFGRGDECQMLFHFPLMPRMFMAIEMEDRFPIVDILDQTPAAPAGCQWAIFLRNHDELTLEMVTDEERDYMYRVYATDPRARINLGIRRRLVPLMGRDRRRVELMNILLFSLPGTPIIYYGDEIGMGDNYYLGDRDGVRTPMQWSPDRNGGFSRANPQKLYLPVIIDPEYHYEAVNVETQERNPTSLLWWMRRIIALRKRFRAFSSGTMETLYPTNPRIFAFIRRAGDEIVLAVVNLSRFSQAVELDLAPFTGMIPEEIFSRNHFPAIRDTPYFLTLGGHDYFWFLLRQPEEPTAPQLGLPRLKLRSNQLWWEVLGGKSGTSFFEEIAPAYLRRCRWFRGKARVLAQLAPADQLQLKQEGRVFVLLLIEARYLEGDPETYLLPLAFIGGESARGIADEFPQAPLAVLTVGDEEGLLCDAIYDADFREALLQLFGGRRQVKSDHRSQIAPQRGTGGRGRPVPAERLLSRVVRVEQSNSAISYGSRFFLKLYRRIEAGINPEAEISRFLSGEAAFAHVPRFLGALEYRRAGTPAGAVGILQEFVKHHGDAWQLTLGRLGHYFERLLTHRSELPPLPEPLPSILDGAACATPSAVTELIGGFYLEMAALLGRRTAELHLTLAGGGDDPAWRLEEFSTLYQRSVYQSMRNLVRRNFELLAQQRPQLDAPDRALADRVLGAEREILARLAQLVGKRISAMKCRIHGDFHLGQVLFTGKDFVIIDFEGEPARTASERRLKRTPLRDVAGMIRSFHYAAMTALAHHVASHPNDAPFLEPWAEAWYVYISCRFLGSYLDRLAAAPLVPADRRDLEILLRCFLLDKAVYELGYELNNRPAWVALPLRGIEMALQEYHHQRA